MINKVPFASKSTTYQKEEQALLNRLVAFFDVNRCQPGSSNHFVGWARLTHILGVFAELKVNLIGGAITSVFSNQPIKDLDLYLEDPSKLDEFIKFLKSPDMRFQEHCVTDTAITMKVPIGSRVYTIQVVTAFTGTTDQIFNTFDFTICAGAYNFSKGDFELHPRFLPDIAKRTLVYMGGSRYPICALYRIAKYQERGYKCPGSTIMHLALATNALQINTYAELKKQLRGIDTLFLQGYLETMTETNVPFDYAEAIADIFKYLDTGISVKEPPSGDQFDEGL